MSEDRIVVAFHPSPPPWKPVSCRSFDMVEIQDRNTHFSPLQQERKQAVTQVDEPGRSAPLRELGRPPGEKANCHVKVAE